MLGVLPLGVFVAFHGRDPVRWIPPLGGGALPGFFAAIGGNGGWWLLGLEVVAIVSCAWAARHAREKFVVVFSLLLIPILLTIAACVVQPCFVARYLNPCLAALILIVAAGVAQLKVIPAGLLAAAISVGCCLGLASYYQKDFDLDRGNWRGVSSFVLERAKPGDDAFYPTFSGMPLEYYKGLVHRDSPRSVVAHDGLPYTAFLRMSIAEELMNARAAGDRVWLLLDERDGSRINTMMRSYFGRGRRLVEERSFDFTTVVLLERE